MLQIPSLRNGTFQIAVGSDDGIVVPRELRQEARAMEELLKEFRQEMRDGFAGVNGRLDKLENRVGSLEGRFETLDSSPVTIHVSIS